MIREIVATLLVDGCLTRRGTWPLGAAAAFLSVACASAPRNPALDKYPAGVIGRTTVVYYDVKGSTVDELHADMRRLGPKIDGTSFVGETRAPMRWGWRTESSGGASCTIRDVTVSVTAQITLPRWTPPPNADPTLVAEWNRFLSALETHEAGHKDISAKAGREVVDQLRGLSGFCSQISTRANDAARVIVERAREAQLAYDAATRHGLTQGTGFGGARFRAAVMASQPLTLLAEPRPGTVRGSLPVPLERAWAVMPSAYAANDLVINAIDSAAFAIGDSATVRGRFRARSVSEIVDCGTPPAALNPDSVDVVLFVTSRLQPSEPSGSTLTNTIQAVARPSGAAPIACRSRGVLERRLFEAARSHVTR